MALLMMALAFSIWLIHPLIPHHGMPCDPNPQCALRMLGPEPVPTVVEAPAPMPVPPVETALPLPGDAPAPRLQVFGDASAPRGPPAA